MIKVALVTTHLPERCGLATYAEEFIHHSTNDIDFKIIGRPFDGTVLDRIGDVDVVHYNHVFALFGSVIVDHIRTLRSMGKKTVVTWHESTMDNRNPLTALFDRVVVHHKDTQDGFIYIPNGIWNLPDSFYDPPEDLRTNFIGMAGFPFGFKKFELGAQVAKTLGMKLMAFIPESHHIDTHPVAKAIQAICPESLVVTEYKHQLEIIQRLSTCKFTMSPHDHAGGGISGSVRMGIAARRPVVISRAGRFSDLVDNYADEFYITKTGYPTFQEVLDEATRLLTDLRNNEAKKPKRVIEDMCWEKCAVSYANIYRSLIQ